MTHDADVVLAVRAWPRAVQVVTEHLYASGFRPAGETVSGHQCCWRDGGAQIDLLIPRFTGQRAQRRRGSTGGTLLPTPGGQVIVDVVERLPIVLDGENGHLPRPALANLLLGKASAVSGDHELGRRAVAGLRRFEDGARPVEARCRAGSMR